jgi:hypothetical protein
VVSRTLHAIVDIVGSRTLIGVDGSSPMRLDGGPRALACVRALAMVAMTLAVSAAPGCLVVSLHPSYDDDSLGGWDTALLGAWENAEDRASLQIERGDWKSYRIKYVYPIETGELTGYMTAVGDDRFLDVMPARGEDRGSFLVPVHALLRVRLADDRLELTPLSYDWFFDHVRSERKIPGLDVTLDQKENALIVSPTPALRNWIRSQVATGPMFGAPAVFVRKQAAEIR